jgi:hypothetical protein
LIPQELTEEVTALQERGFNCKAIEEGQRIYLFFQDFPLPSDLYNMEKTDLLVYTANLYPNCGFDMFWVDNKLTLKNGASPRNGEQMETYLGRTWRRFSYHPYQVKPWNPSQDNLSSYIAYIQQRLGRGD